MLLYYITDRSQFPGDESVRRHRLLEKIDEAARSGVDYIQLREKDLSSRQLEALVNELRTGNPKLKTGFLLNSRTDIALACGADGVHLRSDDISADEVRSLWARSGKNHPRTKSLARVTIGVSCHTTAEVAEAAAHDADFAVFGPVFGKRGIPATGLEALRTACRQKIPVLAIGGITLENAEACMHAGAAGIAAIRLFQENEVGKVVAALRRPKKKTED